MTVPGLHVSPGRDMVDYILQQKLPSGSFLLAAPLGNDKWRPLHIANWEKFSRQHGIARFQICHPPQMFLPILAVEPMAQLWHNAGLSDQSISDAGGWTLKWAAVHLYFHCSPKQILLAFSRLHL